MKLRYSVGIATKIIFIATVIVMSAIGVVVYIATDLFREDSVTKVQETNKDTAQQIAERVHGVFQDATEKISLMAQFATRSESPEEARRAVDSTLKGADDFVSFVAYKFNDKSEAELQFISVSESAIAEYNLDPKKFETANKESLLQRFKTKPNELVVLNSSPVFGVPLFTLSFLSKPLDPKNANVLSGRWWFRAEIRHDKVLKLFANNDFVNSFLVDAKGSLMAHSETSKKASVIKAESIVSHPMVEKMLEGAADNHQMSYESVDSETYFGAYKKVGVAGIGVVAEVSAKKALATIERVQYRSFLVMIVVVCLAFLMNFAFSKSITSNLKKLFAATEQVVEGKFNVNLNIKSSDEIGALGQAFLKMTEGLKERDRIKGVFDKFHSKEIAKKLLSGEIKLGGERKQATVFFSDIRGFTALSEKMSPDQVVGMLNEYFSKMVKIIFTRNGVVDKYIGDAILGVWGVPESGPQDAINAVKACLEMRALIKEFNVTRKAKGQPEIKIGMGLHSGELLAGNIGSVDRLEYTVIGDTVNQASRIEGATKMLDTDFLISENTYALVKDLGIVVGPPVAIKAKGKSKPLVVHMVIGHKDQAGKVITALSDAEVEKINSGVQEISAPEEEKTSVISANTTTRTAVVVPHIMPQDEMNQMVWYVVTSPQDQTPVGPLSLAQIALKVFNGQIDYNTALAFKQGDTALNFVKQLPGLERRNVGGVGASTVHIPNVPQTVLPETVVRNEASAGEWYVAGPNGESLGPYTEDELHIALGKGNLTRTTFVWQKGMPNWIALHDMPGFNRRAG